jgi:hypothetical protein
MRQWRCRVERVRQQLRPGPGQAHGDPDGDGLVVAVAQAGQECWAEAGAGRPDPGGGLAQAVTGLPRPRLGIPG